MAETVIKVENLSKSFLIGHQKQERYTALRDVLTNTTRGFVKNASSLIRGKQLMGNDEVEEFFALKDINFEIKQGDRVGIIGRNGAGKSTLLKILSRITEPTSGRITLNGKVASLLEVGTGFHPELTGRENIFLNGAILGMSRNDIKRKFDEIVEFAEVERFLDTPVKRYSSGMYVRLAFAVAANLEPDILIVDEVLAVGDAQFQKKCLGKMEDVSNNEGRTVLFVSHNMGVISHLCNRGILLQSGQVTYQGSPKNAIEKYLSSQSNINEYIYNPLTQKSKPNYIEFLIVKNENNETVSSFAFDESIHIDFSVIVTNLIPNLQIGLSMQDKFNNKVFTVVKEIDYFRTDSSKIIKGSLSLPKELFAPNFYSFVFALWTKDGTVCDAVEGVCPINIHDNGTDLAQYEGVDYGSIIIKPVWNKN